MFVENGVYFVTSRTSEDLPFVCCPLIKKLMFGIIARANSLYPDVAICSWLFMGNHYHGIVINKRTSCALADFMEFVNGEIAKVINRLRGRRNFSVWGKRYDAEILLTPESVINKMAYMFLNPVQAFLVDSIDHYPGAHTWDQLHNTYLQTFYYYGSSGMRKLPSRPLDSDFCDRYLQDHHNNKPHLKQYNLIIEPFAWRTSFDESAHWTIEESRNMIIELVSSLENQIRQTRQKTGKKVIGKRMLKEQSFFKKFTSITFRPRSNCISTCNVARDNFKIAYTNFCQLCREVWLEWCAGDNTTPFPPGAFIPSFPPTSSISFDSIR